VCHRGKLPSPWEGPRLLHQPLGIWGKGGKETEAQSWGRLGSGCPRG
jgi:hypothetical protein